MALGEELQRPLDPRIDEVGNHENDGAMWQQPIQVFEGRADVGSLAFWLVNQDVAKDPERMAASFPRRHDVFNAVGEKQDADAVIVPNAPHVRTTASPD